MFQGQPINVRIDGEGAVILVEIRPPEGHLWQIAHFQFVHDDIVDHRCGFYSYDGATQVPLIEQEALTAGIWLPLYSAVFPGPIWITHTFYLQMYADALADGKKLYGRGLIYRIRGIEDWSNL